MAAPGEERVNILLVDDQPAKLLAYEAVLAQLGENLIKASSAAEAMEILLRTSVAVVLVDVCMPDTDGFDLTALIRSHPRFRETAIILVSGVHLNDLDRLRGYDLGAVDYIPVPVVPEMLLAKVRVFIDLFRKTRRLREMNRELERRVAERTRELRRSNDELRQFAYVASHDLQEPLRMVSSFVDLFLRRHGKDVGSDGEELLRYVVDGVQRMRQLINDLLAYARLERSPSTTDNVDCERALASALDNLRVALQESAARVTHGPLPHVRGDEQQIVQLLQNLIGNSIKFHRPDVPPHINLQAAESGDEWTFTLEDNGIGIEPEHRERVFQVFQRLNPREQYPGTGIGLAICRKIVEQHLGRIWIGASMGPGSVFHFTLPKAENAPVAAPPAAAVQSPESAQVERAPDPVALES
jgi:signal transduction histidine kinase